MGARSNRCGFIFPPCGKGWWRRRGSGGVEGYKNLNERERDVLAYLRRPRR